MSGINHQDAIVTARDTLFGDEEEQERLGPAIAVSQDEVDELLYNEEIPAAERTARLRQMRDQLAAAGSVDASDSDAQPMVREIERAIAELEGLPGEGMDPASVDHNPEDHRETLSPDDDLLLDLQDGDGDGEADLFGEDYVEEPAEDAPDRGERDEDGLERGKGVH
jgi:hypothetical protein